MHGFSALVHASRQYLSRAPPDARRVPTSARVTQPLWRRCWLKPLRSCREMAASTPATSIVRRRYAGAAGCNIAALSSAAPAAALMCRWRHWQSVPSSWYPVAPNTASPLALQTAPESALGLPVALALSPACVAQPVPTPGASASAGRGALAALTVSGMIRECPLPCRQGCSAAARRCFERGTAHRLWVRRRRPE